MDDLIDFGYFFVRGYLPLIRKDSVTHMHDLAVYVKEGPPFTRDIISWKFCWFSLMFSTGFTSFSVYFFFLYWSPSTSLRTVFYAILSNIDKVLSITPSANETLTSTIRTGSPILVGSDTLGVLCYNFPISNDLIQIVKFPTQIPDCDCHSPTLLDFFLSSDASICCKIVFPPLGNSDHVIISVSIDFPSNLKEIPPFYSIAYDYSRAGWDGLCDHWRDILW